MLDSVGETLEDSKWIGTCGECASSTSGEGGGRTASLRIRGPFGELAIIAENED